LVLGSVDEGVMRIATAPVLSIRGRTATAACPRTIQMDLLTPEISRSQTPEASSVSTKGPIVEIGPLM
jgi:hypothetical protein